MSDYPRMKYAHDQREWVRMANEQIPQVEIELTKIQLESADLFQAMQAGYNQSWSFNLSHDTNQRKHNLMHRLIQLHGMRNANA